MTAFSIQPIRKNGQQTIFFQLREAVAKFQYPCVNGLNLLLFSMHKRVCLTQKKDSSFFPSSRFIRIYIFSVSGNLRIPTGDKCDTELFNK